MAKRWSNGVAAIGFALMALAGGSASAQTAPALSEADTRELIDAAKATAKATRETVDYVRVTPDLLYQILTKLDKLEDKLDKVENAVKAQSRRSGASSR
jgi:Skp family chaperone for outer membrane proteins